MTIYDSQPIPVWFESHDGNSSDKTSFHETIKEFDSFTQSLRDSESFLWVADSALYTEGKLQESGIRWLTHPPETDKQVNPTQPNPTQPNPTQQPTLCWIFIMLRGISCAYLDNECVGVINIGEREANIIKLMGEKVTEIYCIK